MVGGVVPPSAPAPRGVEKGMCGSRAAPCIVCRQVSAVASVSGGGPIVFADCTTLLITGDPRKEKGPLAPYSPSSDGSLLGRQGGRGRGWMCGVLLVIGLLPPVGKLFSLWSACCSEGYRFGSIFTSDKIYIK